MDDLEADLAANVLHGVVFGQDHATDAREFFVAANSDQAAEEFAAEALAVIDILA